VIMRLVSLLMFGAVITAQPALARKSDKQVLRETGASFGDCVADKHYAKSVAFIIEAPDNSTAMKKYRALADVACMGDAIEGSGNGGIRFSGDTFAYTIAEGLVRKDFPTSGPQTFDDRANLVHRSPQPASDEALAKMKQKKRAEAEEAHRRDIAWMVISAFGECAVRLAPEPVRQLAQTKVGSADERMLLQGLAPTFGKCLPTGTNVKFQPLQLRGTLLLNYYRLASAPIVQPPMATSGGQ
jgi:hypothetical protein